MRIATLSEADHADWAPLWEAYLIFYKADLRRRRRALLSLA